MTKYKWWTLTPDFYDGNFFKPNVNALYANASDGNGTYVIYLYNRSTASGELVNLDTKATYTLTWFNPRTNEYTNIDGKVTGKSTYALPNKPDIEDWVLIATKNRL